MLRSKYPLLKCLFPLVLGILLADLGIELGLLSYILLASYFVLLMLFLWKQSLLLNYLFGFFTYVCFFLIGFLLQKKTIDELNFRKFSKAESLYKVELLKELKSSENWLKYIGQLRAQRLDNGWEKVDGKMLLHLSKEAPGSAHFLPADQLLVHARLNKIRPPPNPGQFDYGSYLSRQGVVIKTYSSNFLHIGFTHSILRYASKLRRNLNDRLESSDISHESLSVLKAILLGDKSDLDHSVRSDFATAGAMHILAVSGLHLGIIYLIFDKLLNLLRLKRYRWLKASLLWVLLWSFAFLTGLSNSVMRSALMFSLIILSDVLNRKSVSLNILAASAIFLLLLDPNKLFDLGFQLSYAAVFGILIIYPPLAKLFETKNGLIKRLIDLMLISIAAQLSTLPIVLAFFHQFPNYFLLSNLLIVPLAFVLVSGGVLLCFLLFIFGSAFGLDQLMDGLLQACLYLVEQLAALPYAITEHIYLEELSVIALIFSLFLIVKYIYNYRSKYFLAALGALVAVLLIELYQHKQIADSSSFTVYSTNPPKVVSYRTGSQAEVIYLDSLSDFEEQMIYDHLYAEGSRSIELRKLGNENDQKQYCRTDSISGLTLLVFANKKVLFKSSTEGLNKFNLEIDLMILRDLVWDSTEIANLSLPLLYYSFSSFSADHRHYNLHDFAYCMME